MKSLIAICSLFMALLLAPTAVAGPYLNTTAMLLRESFAASDWIRVNLGDQELCRMAHLMAQKRTDVANQITVPPEVKKAHPHLILSLANMERAFEAVSQGQISAYTRFLNVAQGEAKTFKAVLGEAGFKMPESRSSQCVVRAEPVKRESTKTARGGGGSRVQGVARNASRLRLRRKLSS